jgi:hypothetical protein
VLQFIVTGFVEQMDQGQTHSRHFECNEKSPEH